MNKCTNSCTNGCSCGCAEDKCDCLRTFLPENMTVTMAYVPFQIEPGYYCVDEAFCKGTLFCDLNKPFKGRCVK